MADEDEQELKEGASGEELEEEELEEEELEEEELEEEKSSGDCPKCPSLAPAWMATFADMATLLMAFFVLILSFVEMDEPSIFKEVSGSMSNSFGVQRDVPSVEPPMGQNIIAQNFKTSKVDPSLIVNVAEETQDQENTEQELKSTTMMGDYETNADAEILRKALANEIARGQVEVKVQNQTIIVVTQENLEAPSVKSEQSEQLDGGLISEDLINVYAKVAETQSQIESEVMVTNDNAVTNFEDQKDQQKDELIDKQLKKVRANLKSQIDQGLANVERVGDQILVQLSTQDSFRSGFAELNPNFVPTLSAMAKTISDVGSKVTVSGHTDNIPIAFSERFLSNWDLSAARAAAVADFLLGQNAVSEDRIDVIGFADTKPIAPNTTPEGRSQNRRIEILIDS
ncbi:MAG: OmpA family protein [Candidatus Azotimanducaceae bacterium]|uniref:Flagellar motor protein MotB n=1 Tax=OM182 bacterium TaxID=2510334 RepID=A0A520RZF6_9GAMM|nr:MAG: flagellar motor protein MotB [OM182 bacterium]